MSNFVLVTDNNSDLPFSFIKEQDIKLLSLNYEMDGNVFRGDDPDNSIPDFYNSMRKGSMPKTQQVNVEQASNMFEAALKAGNDCLYLAFSSGLSGSCQSAQIAAKELAEQYPNNKVVVVDSLAASMGQGLLVYKATMLRNAGKSIDEVASWLEENKLHLAHMFTVDDLNHLYRGGRVSKTTAIFGTMLGIKPILHVDDAGKLVPIGKVRGRRQSLVALVDGMEKRMGSFDNSEMVMISHGDCEEDAKFVQEEIKKRFKLKNFMMNYVGPTIGAHSGPGTVALFFMGENR